MDRWRVGKRVALNVYEGDRTVCQCHSFMDALEIVNAMNAMARPVGGDSQDTFRLDEIASVGSGSFGRHFDAWYIAGGKGATLRAAIDDLAAKRRTLPISGPPAEDLADSPDLGDKPPLTSPHSPKIPERGNGPREQWNLLGELARVKGELDAANQHVKILQEAEHLAVESGWIVTQPSVDACEHHGLPAGYYWVWYEGDWIPGNWDGEDWNLLNGVTTTSRHVRRGLRIADPPAGGPPTEDLAARLDSNEELKAYDSAYQAINRMKRYRIGVHDYASLVSCLRSNWETVFPGPDVTDPQNMIQLMAAEIQHLRSMKNA